MKRLLALILLSAISIFAQGGHITQNPWASSRQGYPVAGASVAVCQAMSTTAASVSSNLAIFTMASNPITAGFTQNMLVQISGFTGADTYFNNGTLSNGILTNGLPILSVTSTQIIVALTHGNASATTNGQIVQMGNATTPCAGLSAIYTDVSMVTTQTNPFTTDGMGNYDAVAISGIYYIQLYGSGITTTLRQITIPVALSPGSILSIPNLNNILYVDGVKYPQTTAGIQAAIAALPIPAGIVENCGTVILTSGLYAMSTTTLYKPTCVNLAGQGPSSTILSYSHPPAIAIQTYQIESNPTSPETNRMSGIMSGFSIVEPNTSCTSMLQYASGTTYSANQCVVYTNGNSTLPYIALAGSNTGNTPSSSPSYWGLLPIGIFLGGNPADSTSGYYGTQQQLDNLAISGEGMAVTYGNNAPFPTMSFLNLAANAIGVYLAPNVTNSGEKGVIEHSYFNGNQIGLYGQGGGASSDVYISDSSFDFLNQASTSNSGVAIIWDTNTLNLKSDHIEQLSGTEIFCTGVCFQEGGQMLLDTSGGSADPEFISVGTNSAGVTPINTQFTTLGTEFSSGHTVTSLVNSTQTGGNLQLNILYPQYVGGFTLTDDVNSYTLENETIIDPARRKYYIYLPSLTFNIANLYLGNAVSGSTYGSFAIDLLTGANRLWHLPDASGAVSLAAVEACGATSGATQNCAKTAQTNPIIVFGDVTLNSSATQAITTLPFSAAGDYSCSGSDLTTAAGTVSFPTYTSGAQVTIQETSGTTGDHLRYMCVGF